MKIIVYGDFTKYEVTVFLFQTKKELLDVKPKGVI
jgi:hypothetical protein